MTCSAANTVPVGPEGDGTARRAVAASPSPPSDGPFAAATAEPSAVVPSEDALPLAGSVEVSRLGGGDSRGASRATGRTPCGALSDAVLSTNAAWFCRLRWVCVAFLTVFGLGGTVPGLFARLGLNPRPLWPFAVAALLGLSNVLFLWYGAAMRRRQARDAGRASLWLQIASDLVLLTVVVHYAGPWETDVRMAYLFHIVLACIFFPPRQSAVVLLSAGVLYGACVALDASGVLVCGRLFAPAAGAAPLSPLGPGRLLDAIGAPAVWAVVWYLTSFLSEMVRAQDEALACTNRRLEAAQEERTRHLLVTTHELKAPFAAIHANAQLLSKGHCGKLPQEALAIVLRISARSQRLGRMIQDMLQLANLNSATQNPPDRTRVDLLRALRWSLDQARPLAEERQVRLDLDLGLGPLLTWAAEDHLKMLLSNLLTNAITYSRDGGCVTVRCSARNGQGPHVVIQDRGIGIAPAKLPRVFDEYYRTEEAVKHFRESTGLGLTIVRQILRSGGIGATLSSEPDVGTRWDLDFPTPWPPDSNGSTVTSEVSP